VPLALSTEGGGTYGIPIILDWITFSIWKSNLVLQRGLSVVMGVLCIYVLFLLTEELFGSWTGLLAAFFMAVSPWHNAHSRYTQVIFSIAILFTLLSVYFVVKALRQRRLGWIVLAVLALAFDFYIYPSAQFIVFVLVLFWLYSMVRHREYWRRCLFCGLLTLIVVALLIAPRTHLFGPVSKIRLINNPVGQRADYATQSLQVAGLNIMKLAQSLLLKSTDMDTWFEKEGAILLWPVSIAFLCGLAWCLPRVGDTTYALLVLWFAIGVIPTIFSPNVFARRIICANPVIYMMAALSVMIGCAPLARALPARLKILRNLLAAAGLVLFSSAAFAAFYYHTVVYEERYHVEQRRIAEIVCENIQDYYVYLNYEPHQIEEDVWVYCGSYCPAGQEELPVTFSRKGEPAKEALPSLRVGPQGTVFGASSIGAGDAIIGLLKKAFPENERESHKELPVTFFQKEELENKVLPALRAGPKGTLFCVPANGDAIIGILKATFPEGKLEQYKLDKDYFDHSRGSPLCRTYAISREELSQRGEPHAPVALPRVEEAAPSREEHRASPTPTASPVRPARISGGARGEGPGEYNEPRGIALDNKGNVYVADFRNYRMQKFDRSGQFVLAWGGRGDGRGQFNDPCGVAVGGDGKVYVADTFNNRIQVFDRDGKYIFNFGGDFYAPRGIAVDRSGRIWVADSGNGVVKIFSGKGENIKVIGKKGKGNGEFDSPTGIAMDQKGNIYVADTGNKRVQILDKEGGYLREFPVDGWKQGAFNEPYLDVDSRGEVFLTDPPGNRVLRFSQKGKLAGTLAPMEESQPMLSFPMGIVVEKKGEAVYVVDCRHHRICKFSKKDFK
ncbi:MAG: 6-bladed beta-propeller, partial [Candidatus Aureabacteria bacterium]|nr:6-bladed beta-propeller [Candidatus Auribacterota bacterium]